MATTLSARPWAKSAASTSAAKGAKQTSGVAVPVLKTASDTGAATEQPKQKRLQPSSDFGFYRKQQAELNELLEQAESEDSPGPNPVQI